LGRFDLRGETNKLPAGKYLKRAAADPKIGDPIESADNRCSCTVLECRFGGGSRPRTPAAAFTAERS